MAHLDIIVYALVACILLVRLWGVLGRRNDDEQQRPNPFATPAPGSKDDASFRLDRGSPDNAARPVIGQQVLAPMSLLSALEQVKQLDTTFDEKAFLQQARSIFTSVVVDFAKGDLSEVQKYLGPTVLPGFQSAIETRQKAGETLETHIARIADAETTTARTGENRIIITVRISSEQENILRDASGKVLSGTPGKTEEIIDLWSFARDAKSPNADWQVIETRS